MRKTNRTSLLLALALSASLCGCGGAAAGSAGTTAAPASTAAQTTASETAAGNASEAAAETSAEDASGSAAGSAAAEGLSESPIASGKADLSSAEASPEWVASLKEAESATQLFVVAGIGDTSAWVSMHEKDQDGSWKQIMSTPGYIGKMGLGKTMEGDSKTPVGTFRFNKAFGIAADPGCAIPYTQVDDDYYWSGDVREGYGYNTMVRLSELPDLNQDDSEHIVDYLYQYQYCLNISYNEEGTPGRGSAIFLHCLGPVKPYTGGCVAIPENQMIRVMQNVQEDCVVVIDSLKVLSPETWDEYGLSPAFDGAADYESQVLEAEGLKLFVPAEYKDLVQVNAGAESNYETELFSVSEKASIEAAKAQGWAEGDGPGWLFSIGKISEKELHELLCSDMSFADVVAKDDAGDYYLFYHPTDVRLVRENNEEMDKALLQWTSLNNWANKGARRSFILENGLTPVSFGNSNPEIYLYKILYDEKAPYTVSTTEFGPLEPKDVDPAPFVSRLMDGATFEYSDEEEAPDGEYVVLNFPEEDVRFDFFTMEGKENIIRQVIGDDDENGTLFKVTYEDPSVKATSIMQEWYKALAEKR